MFSPIHSAHGRAIMATKPQSLLPAECRFVAFGDSRINYGASFTAGAISYSNAQGVAGWALARLAGSVYAPPKWNAGIVGNTTDQMDTRFATDVAALNPKLMLFWGWVNDLKSTSRTFAQITTSILSIVAKARALGIKMVVMNEPASSTITAGRETLRVQLNTWILTLVAKDLLVCDISAINTTDLSLFSDAVHPVNAGASLLSTYAVPVLMRFVRPLLAIPTANNILTNSVFAGAGAVATGWSVFNNGGGATVTTALVTKNGRVYQEVTLSGTYTGAGKLVNILQQSASTPAGWVVGDILESMCHLEVDPNPVSLNSVYFGGNVGAAKTRSLNSTSDQAFPSSGFIGLVRSPGIDFATSTGYQALMSIVLPTVAAATAVDIKARFALPILRKVPSL